MTEKFIGQMMHHAADAAGDILRHYFLNPPPVEYKKALSPVVTLADREAEDAMRTVIKRTFPDDTIIGEEGGKDPGTTDRSWVLDPIDGTIAFICGKPTFVTLIGLWQRGIPVSGLIDQPILRQRWVKAVDGSSRLNRSLCKTSGLTDLSKARFGTTDPRYFRQFGRKELYKCLDRTCHLTTLGGDGYLYGLLANGQLDLVVECGLAWHDVAALVPVVEGAGGIITDLEGGAIGPGQESYSVAASATRKLHSAILECTKLD